RTLNDPVGRSHSIFRWTGRSPSPSDAARTRRVGGKWRATSARASSNRSVPTTRLFATEGDAQLRSDAAGVHVEHLLQVDVPVDAQCADVAGAIMRRRHADEKGDFLFHERLIEPRVVRWVAADADLERRNAEIPAAELRHRDVEPDAAVGAAVVV